MNAVAPAIFNSMTRQPQPQQGVRYPTQPAPQPTPASPQGAGTPAGNPALRDIFKYIGTLNAESAETPWRTPNDMQDGFSNGTFTYRRQGGGEDGRFTEAWELNPDSWLGRVNQQYGMNLNVARDQGEQAQSWRANFDTSKLPQTRFGDVSQAMTTDEHGSNLQNPAMKYYDPNYGWISPVKNHKSGNEWLGPTLMMIASMGMGALPGVGAAGTGLSAANSALRGAQGLMNGGDPMQFLLNLAVGQIPGMQNLSPYLRPMVNMAIRQMVNQARNGRGRG